MTPAVPTCHGYELVNDLDFTDSDATGYQAAWDPVVQKAKAEAQRSQGWTPIGPNEANRFTGAFEGNGHVIKNLYINRTVTSSDNVGLFGFVADCTIQNVGLTGEHMLVNVSTSAFVEVGTLVGTFELYSGPRTIIRNCYSTGDVTVTSSNSENARVGGLVGAIGFDGPGLSRLLSNCHVAGDVTATGTGVIFVGGLVGFSQDHTTLEHCYTTGNVMGTAGSPGYTVVGGVLGDNNGSSTNFHYGMSLFGQGVSYGSKCRAKV